MPSPGFLTQVPFSTRNVSDQGRISLNNRSIARRDSASSTEDDDTAEDTSQQPMASEAQRATALPQSSSDASIECVPIHNAASPEPDVVPFPLTTPLSILSHFALARLPRNSLASRPMAHPVWRGRISKKQQSILDCDDSYRPPLVGKSTRPGSVPLDIQQALIRNADRLNHTTEQNGIVQNSNLPRSPLQLCESSQDQNPPRSTVSDDDGDLPTQYASQWDSSPPQPPRRQAPPDTSPIRQPIPITMDMAQQQNPTRDDAPTTMQTTKSHDDEISTRRFDGQSLASEPDVERERQKVPSSQWSHSLHSREPIKTVPKTAKPSLHAVIQVKETPYTSKENDSRPLKMLKGEAPISSFVAATYPGTRQDEVFLQSGNAHELASNKETPDVRPERQLADMDSPRVDESCSSESFIWEKEARLPELESRRQSPVGLTSEINYRDREEEEEEEERKKDSGLPEPKRRKIAPNPHNSLHPVRDRAYVDIDRRRVLARRTFLRGISTSWTHSGPEDSIAFAHQQIPSHSPITSRSPTPHTSGDLSPALISTNEPSSVTRMSMCENDAHRHGDGGSQKKPSILDGNLAICDNSSLFDKFVVAYPDYNGTRRSFASALSVLLKLRREGRELHPFLWDDFVFRMAYEYKQYLQTCINEDTNALPYQEYYHSQVRKPDRQFGIIDEGVVDHLFTDEAQDHPKSNLAGRQSLAPSRSEHGNIVSSRLDHQIPTPPSRVELSRIGKKFSQLQPKSNPSSIHQGKENERSRGTLIFPTASQSIIFQEAKKRRSLPWADHNPSTLIEHDSVHSQRSAGSVATTPMTTGPADKVEHWLLASRTSGAASPELEERNVSRAATRSPVPQKAYVVEQDTLNSKWGGRASAEENHQHGSTKAGHDSRPKSDAPASRSCLSPSFTLFAKHFGSLQSERILKSNADARRAVPINIYEW